MIDPIKSAKVKPKDIPPVMVSSLPLTITTPGNYKLTGNLAGGITIYEPVAGPVIVDLNGFSITGGIDIEGNTGAFPLIIRNGTINALSSGSLNAAITDWVSNVTIDHVVFNLGRSSSGVVFERGSNSTIIDCQFIGLPGNIGGLAIFENGGGGNRYRNISFQYLGTEIQFFNGSPPLKNCQFAPPNAPIKLGKGHPNFLSLIRARHDRLKALKLQSGN
jgi:hypothetical protein